MKKNKFSLPLLLILAVISVFSVGCSEDENTINTYITGTWKSDSTQTVYNRGLLANYLNSNPDTTAQQSSDTVSKYIQPVFNGSKFTYNADKSGTITLPYLDLVLNATYVVAKGKVTLSLNNYPGQNITLNITTINEKYMVSTMSLSDITKIINIYNNQANGIDIKESLQELIPKLATLNQKLDAFNLSAVGLNLTPTMTLVFNKQ